MNATFGASTDSSCFQLDSQQKNTPYKNMFGRGGGQVVSVIALNSDDRIPLKNSVLQKNVFEKERK